MSSTWSTNPVWQTSSLGAAGIIDSPNLNAYRELLLEIKGLQHGVGTPDYLIQLSADGVTFDTAPANYITGAAVNLGGICFATGVAITSPVMAITELLHFNLATQTWFKVRGGRENNVTGGRTQGGYHSAATVMGFVRITNSTATPFTANGGISVYMRQPQ